MSGYDIDSIIRNLTEEPITIKNIVGDMYGNNSYTNRLKKHLNKACSLNQIFKGSLVGKQSQQIYFCRDKEYLIVNVRNVFGSIDVYCVFDMEEQEDAWVLNNAKVLLCNEWKDINNRTILKKDIIEFF